MSDSTTNTDAAVTETKVAVTEGESGYNPPASQEELDRIIKNRVGRVEAKYADYDELKNAAKKLADMESANQSKEEKLLAELEAAKKEIADRDQKLTQVELRSMRSEVAAAKGVPAAHLSGATTKEEMEAAADELIAWRDAQKPSAPKRTTLRSGASTAAETGLSAKERAARALRGE